VHENRYGDVALPPLSGRLLLSGRDERGINTFDDVVDTSGRLIWRMNYGGWSELLDLMPTRDLRRWGRPRSLAGGDVVLQTPGHDSDERVLLRLSPVDEERGVSLAPGERVVIRAGDQPLARVLEVVEVPPEAVLGPEGRHMLLDPAEGTIRVGDSDRERPIEH